MREIVCAIVALTTLILGGCSQGGDVGLPEQGESLTIKLPEQICVKTSLGESVEGRRSIYWSNGDCIAANGEISSEVEIEGDKSKEAVFNFSSALTYPCNILYPASFYKDATTITLPKLQPAAEGTFATNTLPMATCVAKSGADVVLHHLASVIHLQVKDTSGENEGKHATLLRVEFRGNGAEVISGDFTIDYTNITLSPAEGGMLNDFTAVSAGCTLSTTEVKDIFIVVPAMEYASGFTVRIIDELGHYMDNKKGSAVTLSPGEIYKLPVIEFVPTKTLVDMEIK